MSEDPQELMLQDQQRSAFLRNGEGGWTVVRSSWDDGDSNGAWFAALSDPGQRELRLKDPGWDVQIGAAAPGFVQEYTDGEPITRYETLWDRSGIEPLVIEQEHFSIRPPMLPQLSEHFRLFHNLWADAAGTKLWKVEEDGHEFVAAEIGERSVRVRTSLLRQYQAARQLDLLLFVDSIQYVDCSMSEDDLREFTHEESDGSVTYLLAAGDARFNRRGAFSRYLATRVVQPPPIERCGVWPFDESDEEDYLEFIIGEGQDGQPVTFTCDHRKLANYFGANPEAPHYLTPVHFQPEVLNRYYDQPEKFEVRDGYLSCGGLWGVQLDNHDPSKVVVFLGDLGRDLPERERSHWKTYNVPPTGPMSETAIRRSFLGQFAYSGAPDHIFRSLYGAMIEASPGVLGWPFYKELHPDDAHVLSGLRVPPTNSQPAFEEQLLNLAKLLVDALNEKGIGGELPDKVEGEQGITKLERWLEQVEYPMVERDVAYLRRLQRLRSKVSAHRKSSKHERLLEDEGVDEDRREEVSALLRAGSRMIQDLADFLSIPLR